MLVVVVAEVSEFSKQRRKCQKDKVCLFPPSAQEIEYCYNISCCVLLRLLRAKAFLPKSSTFCHQL